MKGIHVFFKRCVSLFEIMLLLGIVACSNNSKNIKQNEEQVVETSQSLKFKVFKKEIPSSLANVKYYASVEYPISGPKVLVDKIRNWINQTVYEAWVPYDPYGESKFTLFNGDMEDVDALVSHYLKLEDAVASDIPYLKNFVNSDMPPEEIILNFSKVYETDKYISIAAGLRTVTVSDNTCATFIKSESKRLSTNKVFDKFDKKTKEILWRYKNDDFTDFETQMKNVHEIDFSGMTVCLQGDSIRFYIPIPGTWGSGTIIVPTSAIEMYLSKDVKTLLK